jgi:hypothetical protein
LPLLLARAGGWLYVCAMNTGRLAIGVIIAAVAGVCYTLFKATSQLEFGSIKMIGKPKFSLTGVEIMLSMSLKNNSKTALPFDSYAGALMYGSHKIAVIQITEKQVVKPKVVMLLPVRIKIGWLEVAGEVKSMIQSADFLNGLFITGSIKSAGVSFPVQKIKVA